MPKTKKIWVTAQRIQRTSFDMRVPINATMEQIDALAEEEADKEMAEDDFDTEVEWESADEMSVRGDV